MSHPSPAGSHRTSLHLEMDAPSSSSSHDLVGLRRQAMGLSPRGPANGQMSAPLYSNNSNLSQSIVPSQSACFYPMQPPRNSPSYNAVAAISSNVVANVVRSVISPDKIRASGLVLDVRSESSCTPSRSETPSSALLLHTQHEKALGNFAKTKDILKEHMKGYLKGKNPEHPRQTITPTERCSNENPGEAGSGSGTHATGTEQGQWLVEVVRSAMDAADNLDNDPAIPAGSLVGKDWRDVDDAVGAPSVFFESQEMSIAFNNRVMEAIIAKGHAAQTDDELGCLYRHTHLLNLLEEEDLKRIASLSLRREYMQGDTIVGHGEELQHFYTVVWGDVDVFQVEDANDERRAMEGAFRVSTQTQVVSESSARAFWRCEKRDVPELVSMADRRENSGDVESVTFTSVATLLPGQVFGMQALVFDEKSKFLFRAGGVSRKTVMALIPFGALREVLQRNPRFSQGLCSAIAGSFDVFGPIREFCRYVFSPTTSQNEYLPLWSIVESYTRIHNVIHTKLFSKELDTGAWGYALNRLPENVTSTFCFDLVHALPPFVASRMRVEARAADVRKSITADERHSGFRTSISYIRTKERRRCTWQLGMEGKTLVLLREGFTDLLDFLTMLCTHIIESNKLRGRVQGMVHPPAIDILDEFLRRNEEEVASKVVISPQTQLERVKGVLSRMPLTSEEQNGLLRNWGTQAPMKIYEVMMHREEFNVRVDPSISRRFQTNPFHEWALNLRACVLEKLGLDRSSPFPDDLSLDVVSSNTHCIKNLLSPFMRKYKSAILEYALKHEANKLGQLEDWHNVDDMMYGAANGFLQNERPDLKEEYAKTLEESGITVLNDTAMTGLQVDVIPVHFLSLDMIDETIRDSVKAYHRQLVSEYDEKDDHLPAVPTWAQVCRPVHDQQRGDNCAGSDSGSCTNDFAACRLRRHFIINMDFAFGAQAEGICRAVFGAFGSHIRSVSVMGKAGGMRGRRGDIQLASHVLLSKSSLIMEDNQDELRSCRNQDLSAARLSELAGPRVEVHHGKVLTVTGTMLQNVQLLRYYKYIWGCVGTEMEGSYFARVIEDFYRQGIAHPQLVSRFAYYTSDMPLAQSEAEADQGHRAGAAMTLSAPMTAQEGVPPLYAIARGILEKVMLP